MRPPDPGADPGLVVDVAVLGGGIAALWTRASLAAAGYRTVLLSAGPLGGVQTLASQGIIHGGMKYALSSSAREAAQAIRAMPDRWRRALAGNDPVDLSGATVLSRTHWMWAEGAMGKATARIGSSLVSSAAREIPREEWPEPFRSAPPSISAGLFALDELVVDVPGVVERLAEAPAGAVVGVPSHPAEVDTGEAGGAGPVTLGYRMEDGTILRIRARMVVLAAGAGNGELARAFGLSGQIRQQLRPLHMVMARGHLPPVYVHRTVALSDKPALTITTHPLADGNRVWYLGGNLAEEGVGVAPDQQRRRARNELASLFPWFDLSGVEFATFAVDRAEAARPDGSRPSGLVVDRFGAVLVAWPTKLALAPALADAVTGAVAAVAGEASRQPGAGTGSVAAGAATSTASLAGIPPPPRAQPPWRRPDLEWSR